jgi:hypothetical protein
VIVGARSASAHLDCFDVVEVRVGSVRYGGAQIPARAKIPQAVACCQLAFGECEVFPHVLCQERIYRAGLKPALPILLMQDIEVADVRGSKDGRMRQPLR